ncbi:serine/threonine protein kinase, partial [Streptosporangium sp. NPDC087985]|uniref:serine/threonine protein kinase n=1 Tax=Streptosporangium sp. NPDC087985 TaxID=3366196 RepID=UPI00382D3694
IHLAGLTHGAFTPDSVILGPDGPRVCDIGLGLTGSEPDYRAPERLHAELNPGSIPAPGSGRAADLFSWAATLAYAATGQPPFEGQPAHVIEGPANLTGIPPELAALLAACLDKRPHGRPDTKTAMLRLLGEESAIQITGESRESRTAGPETGPDSPGGTAPAAGTGNDAGARAGTVPGTGAPQPTAPPAWGAPALPVNAPPADAPPAPAAAPAGNRPKSSRFPLVLAACVGVFALLSGLGLWAAGSSAPLGDAQRAAANEKITDVLSAPAGQRQGGGEAPADGMTTPGGTTADPQAPDVRQIQLPTENPAAPSPVSSVALPPSTVPTYPATTAPEAKKPGDGTTPTSTAKPKSAPKNTGNPKSGRTSKPTSRPTSTRAPKADSGRKSSQAPAPTPTRTAQPMKTAQPTKTAQPAQPTKTAQPMKTAQPTSAPKPTQSTPPPSRPNPYSPQQVCGSGYYVQRSASFSGGTVYQLYNTSTGSNCVVTMKSTDVGTATSVFATLEVQGGGSRTDRGNYEYYAGPVILSAKGKCVRFTGGGSTGSTGADWANCG